VLSPQKTWLGQLTLTALVVSWRRLNKYQAQAGGQSLRCASTLPMLRALWSKAMKYIFLIVFLVSSNVYSCILGPAQLEASKEFGFTHEEALSKFHESINEIRITAPLNYKNKRFELGIFIVFLKDKVVSKSVHTYINDDGVPEFLGYASNEQGFTYSVSFLYGEGRCKAYEFTAVSNHNKLL